jgi:GxxExxY protein
MSNLVYHELSNTVLNSAFKVHRVLGCGLLESAYEGAFEVELKYAGVHVERQVVYPLVYRNEYVGVYIADMVVENKIIVELKSVAKLNVAMEAQLINYLKLSRISVGYLINFHNTSVEWRRFANTRAAAS